MAEKPSTKDSVPPCSWGTCDEPAVGRCTHNYFEFDKSPQYYCDYHIEIAQLTVLIVLQEDFSSAVEAAQGWIAFVTALMALVCWWWYFGGYDFFHAKNMVESETSLSIAWILTVISCCSLIAWCVERIRHFRFSFFRHWNYADAYFSYEEGEIEWGEK